MANDASVCILLHVLRTVTHLAQASVDVFVKLAHRRQAQEPGIHRGTCGNWAGGAVIQNINVELGHKSV